MESLFNYVVGGIGLVAGLLSICQFLFGLDKRQRIQELEARNKDLARTIASLLAGTATGVAHTKEALDHDRPRLQFKHLAHSYDRLRVRIHGAVTAFAGISCVVFLSLLDEHYLRIVALHALAVPLVSMVLRSATQLFLMTKLRSLFEEASYRADSDLTELQVWIGGQPWRQKSTGPALNDAVMKW